MYQSSEKLLPKVPTERVRISSQELEKALNDRLEQAKLSGCWKKPYAGAATSLEEMDIEDIFYWVYKSSHPITQMEDGVTELLCTDSSKLILPHNFTPQKTITMGICGDILRVQAEHLTYSSAFFKNIAPLLFDQTISFSNLESPITTQDLCEEIISDQAPPLECCSEEQFEPLKGYNGKTFTALNFSNNHTFDFGIEGMETTQRVLKENDILDIGTNRTPQEYGKPTIIEKEGMKIGFVSATFGMNGREIPETEQYRIHISKLCSKFVEPELDLLKSQIDECKKQDCDFIIASLHWGWEFEFFPRKSQVEIAHTLVEYGVDAILGAHPHVIQPVEYYKTKRDPNRIAVIAYSLGSLSWGFTDPYLALSLVLNLVFTKGVIDNKTVTYIEKANVTPVFRSCVPTQNQEFEMRIEILDDFISQPDTLYSEEYINKMKHYSKNVLNADVFLI